jgi:hypothetical protein
MVKKIRIGQHRANIPADEREVKPFVLLYLLCELETAVFDSGANLPELPFQFPDSTGLVDGRPRHTQLAESTGRKSVICGWS